MEFRLIKVEQYFKESVIKVVLNSPKANVLEAAMLSEILGVIHSLSNNKNLKLLVFEGAGKHFSFGASVPEHTKDKAAMMLRSFHEVFYQLSHIGVPTMAIVRGQCLGGGMELALFCNFIIADSTAVFGQPEILLGVLPPPASVMLPLKVGQAYADEIALTGRSIDGKEARAMGFVNLLCESGQDAWEEAAKWIENHIVPKSASSLRIANFAVRNQFFRVIREDLPRMEGLYLKHLMETFDANEGIQAFLEKRKPSWKNE
ncbi:MAG: enoyl-CoA hydratase-related protein [Desulfomonilaceae bacterium]